MKFYMLFMILVLLINSIYPLVATYMVCDRYNDEEHICLKSGILYYLDFNVMIQTLENHKLDNMVDVLCLLSIGTHYVANNRILFAVNCKFELFVLPRLYEKKRRFRRGFSVECASNSIACPQCT